MKVIKKIEWCFEKVSRAFQRSYMDVSRKLQGILKVALREF